jgi:hypothetical protein
MRALGYEDILIDGEFDRSQKMIEALQFDVGRCNN